MENNKNYYNLFIKELKEISEVYGMRGGDFAALVMNLIKIIGEKNFNNTFLYLYQHDYKDLDEDAMFTVWHKQFRQIDVAEDVVRMGPRRTLEQNLGGAVDMAFWYSVHADKNSYIYKTFMTVVFDKNPDDL